MLVYTVQYWNASDSTPVQRSHSWLWDSFMVSNCMMHSTGSLAGWQRIELKNTYHIIWLLHYILCCTAGCFEWWWEHTQTYSVLCSLYSCMYCCIFIFCIVAMTNSCSESLKHIFTIEPRSEDTSNNITVLYLIKRSIYNNKITYNTIHHINIKQINTCSNSVLMVDVWRRRGAA